MAKRPIKPATAAIDKLFDSMPSRIFRPTDIKSIFTENHAQWKLPEAMRSSDFIDFLIGEGKLKAFSFDFPYRPEKRYVWGQVPMLELVQSLKPGAYFSHYTAMHIHGLTEQIPKTIYLNQEQTAKPAPMGEPTQQAIDSAFRRPPRFTSNTFVMDDTTIAIVNGKQTGALGVIDQILTDGAQVRVTDPERTLIDATVRPEYAGGVSEVLKAYRMGADRVSVNKLSAYLKKLDYRYPYRQAIGYYLEAAGGYRASSLELLREEKFELDFYLTHDIKEMDYSARWRIFFPKGL